MPIPISSNFDLVAQIPIEAQAVQLTLTARNALSASRRYEGLKVYVVAEQKNYQLIGGILNSNWVESIISQTFPLNGVFEWSTGRYQPYATLTAGAFDIGIVNPTEATRLNYNGYLYSTRLYDSGIRVSVVGHTHAGTYEAILGVPSTNNEVLVSTTGGTRSWSTIASLLPKASITTLGVVRVGTGLSIDINGVLNSTLIGGGGGGAIWGTNITGTITDQTDLMAHFANYASVHSPTFTGTVSGISAAMVGALASGATAVNSALLDNHNAAYFQVALSNPVTGTGTTNYIPRFSGTSTIANSVLKENSGNVECSGDIIAYSA